MLPARRCASSWATSCPARATANSSSSIHIIIRRHLARCAASSLGSLCSTPSTCATRARRAKPARCPCATPSERSCSKRTAAAAATSSCRPRQCPRTRQLFRDRARGCHGRCCWLAGRGCTYVPARRKITLRTKSPLHFQLQRNYVSRSRTWAS